MWCRARRVIELYGFSIGQAPSRTCSYTQQAYVQVVSERDNTNSFCEVNIKNVNQMKKENDPTVKIRIRLRHRHIRGQRILRELLAPQYGACFMTQMSRGRN